MTSKFLPHILIFGLILFFGRAYSQTTAMDFDQADCSGANHHLFSDLDNGQVVVITFIELNCSSCIVATNGIKTLLPPFEVSNPGRVELFSFGYDDNYTCSQMLSWKNAYGYTHPVFSGGGAQTNYYGGMGMPTVVVLGGPDHTVLYKSLGYSSADKPAISAAITAGLALSSGISEDLAEKGIRVYPTLFDNQIHLDISKPMTLDVVVYDLLGKVVLKESGISSSDMVLNTAGLNKGIYALKLISAGNLIGTLRVIKQ